MVRDRRGQSLLELLLVMGLLALMAGAALRMVTVGDRSATRAAAYMLAADLRLAQEQAVATGTECWVRLTPPADPAAAPVRYALRCGDGAGLLAFRPDVDLDPGVRLDGSYLAWEEPATAADGVEPGWTTCRQALVNVDNQCYAEVAFDPNAEFRIGFSPSGLRATGSGHVQGEVLVRFTDRSGGVGQWVRILAPTGEVRVCRPHSEQKGGRIRIQCR